MKNKLNLEDLKNEIQVLIKKSKDENASPAERLAALRVLNSIIEFNVRFMEELKKELDIDALTKELGA